MRAHAAVLLVLPTVLTACADGEAADDDPPRCRAPTLPSGDGPLELVAAGAPLARFGDPASPRFEQAFDALAAEGFDHFFPWFGRSEVDGVADVSPHFEHFLPPGVGAYDCTVANPYAAARGRLGVVFPAFLLVDAEGDEPLDEAVFRSRYDLFERVCWGGDDDVIAFHEAFDEIVNARVVNAYFGRPGPRLENVPAAARLLQALSDAPVVVVEAPTPAVLAREPSLTPDEVAELTALFWDGVHTILPGLDYFGFDVYPLPDFPLSLPGDYTREAGRRSPETRRLAVLQAFSRAAESARTREGRGPTLEEQRFMAFDAVVAGATLLVWYGGSFLDPAAFPEDGPVWDAVTTVVGELAALDPAYAGARTPLDVEGGEGVAHRLDAGWLLTVVRRAPTPGSVRVTLPPGSDRAVDEAGRALRAVGGVLELELPAHGVALLRAHGC